MNILIDSEGRAKISDFGIAKMKVSTSVALTSTTLGTIQYSAPEILKRAPRINEKCDVYSFGMLLYEMVTNQIPFQGLDPFQVVQMVAMDDARPSLPEIPASNEILTSICNIINDCWKTEPMDRPSFLQILSTLEKLAEHPALHEKLMSLAWEFQPSFLKLDGIVIDVIKAYIIGRLGR